MIVEWYELPDDFGGRMNMMRGERLDELLASCAANQFDWPAYGEQFREVDGW